MHHRGNGEECVLARMHYLMIWVLCRTLIRMRCESPWFRWCTEFQRKIFDRIALGIRPKTLTLHMNSYAPVAALRIQMLYTKK